MLELPFHSVDAILGHTVYVITYLKVMDGCEWIMDYVMEFSIITGEMYKKS